MYYFIQFWLVLINLFIISGKLQAADIAEKTENISIVVPIEPIEPKGKTETNFWQKTKQKLRWQGKNKAAITQVEPISKGWYIFWAIFISLWGIGGGIYGIVLLVLAIIAAFAGGGLLFLGFSILGVLASLVFAIPFIIYAIKLFQAAFGVEDKFLKGKRFLLGYICFIILLVGLLFLGFALATFTLNSYGGGAMVFRVNIFIPYLLGALISLGGLIFNGIDRKRYKQHLKEQQTPSK